MFKEQLVRLLNALTDILHSLRAYQLPERVTFPQLSNMFLKSRTVQVLSPHPVVPLMQGYRMVVDYPSSID
jgi:hypothetical protein